MSGFISFVVIMSIAIFIWRLMFQAAKEQADRRAAAYRRQQYLNQVIDRAMEEERW